MLSSSYNILEFMRKVEHCGYEELIQVTNREATETERHFYKYRHSDQKSPLRQDYALTLKGIILFLRHGVRTRALDRVDIDRLTYLRQA